MKKKEMNQSEALATAVMFIDEVLDNASIEDNDESLVDWILEISEVRDVLDKMFSDLESSNIHNKNMDSNNTHF